MLKYSALENEKSSNDKYLSLGRSYCNNYFILLLSRLRTLALSKESSAIISEESTGKSINKEWIEFLLDISTL